MTPAFGPAGLRFAALELRSHPAPKGLNPLRGLMAERVGFEPTVRFQGY